MLHLEISIKTTFVHMHVIESCQKFDSSFFTLFPRHYNLFIEWLHVRELWSRNDVAKSVSCLS